jgi:N-methylhydantoinase A
LQGIRIGIDVGGTFTDGASIDPDTGRLAATKTLTTKAQVEGTSSVLDDLSPDLRSVAAIVHGTTLVTNTLVERTGPPVGLITTAGFRDILEIRRTLRPHLYDVAWRKPPALVPRRFRREVRERIGANGNVLMPLNLEDVGSAAELFRRNGIVDIAVCYLFSFRNPRHEQETRDIIRRLIREARISLSSEVLPEYREYERTSTTVLNAMAKAAMERYLGDLETSLKRRRFAGELRLLKADGGVASASNIAHRSAEAFHSGPAGGVIGAASLGRALGHPNILTFDMGGTTTDVSLIWGGEPVLTMEEEVDFGIPIRVPMVYVRSVGAGGGSIAWIDEGGALRVGPRSSGATPGPACYGRGGAEATVTDANVELRRIDPEYFLGGRMALRPDRATEAVAELGQRFGWSPPEAARAISNVALSNMVQASREVSTGRGYDPRDFVLMAFGGAGPLYAAELARELGIREVIIPRDAGVFSAVGCLHANYKHERLRTIMLPAQPDVAPTVEAACDELASEAVAALGPVDSATVSWYLDIRYVGEAFDLTVPVSDGFAGWGTIEAAIDRFHTEHERLYGFSRADPVEIVNARVRAVSPVAHPAWRHEHSARAQEGLRTGSRLTVLPDGSRAEFAVHHRRALAVGHVVEGPAIVQDDDSTTLVFPGDTLTLDECGNVRISVGVSVGV